jgi:hypothetical protein
MSGLPGGSVATVSCSPTAVSAPAGGLLAEALLGYPVYAKIAATAAVTATTTSSSSGDIAAALTPTRTTKDCSSDDLPLGATFETPGLKAGSISPSSNAEEVNIELDNAGRVKSGKVKGFIAALVARYTGTI